MDVASSKQGVVMHSIPVSSLYTRRKLEVVLVMNTFVLVMNIFVMDMNIYL